MKHGAVLITGGTGTLGGALVRALCAGGVRVFANYCRDDERAARLRDETGCDIVRADIGDENAVRELFEALPPLFGVVHAAGVSSDSLLLRQSRESWHETLRVNATGAFLVARAALQRLEDGGRLILISSRVGERGAAGQSAYAASKSATLALMKCAAQEGAARKLCVNALCPPFVPSALSETLRESKFAALRGQSLREGVGDARSSVGAALWLLGESGDGVSGQVIHCDDRMF